MSTKNRQGLHEAVVQEIRRFIAGAILQNQKIADAVGLHLTDTQCINVLELVGPTTPGNLARSTGLTTGGVTVMLDRLEKAGYVKREPNPQDRRSLLVRTNPRKLEKLHSYYGEINRRLGAYLEQTSEADLGTVVDFLAGMNSLRAETPHGKAGPARTAAAEKAEAGSGVPPERQGRT
jgi:MarR family transcriptional regulator, organic hydroperoxide resistance regulator